MIEKKPVYTITLKEYFTINNIKEKACPPKYSILKKKLNNASKEETQKAFEDAKADWWQRVRDVLNADSNVKEYKTMYTPYGAEYVLVTFTEPITEAYTITSESKKLFSVEKTFYEPVTRTVCFSVYSLFNTSDYVLPEDIKNEILTLLEEHYNDWVGGSIETRHCKYGTISIDAQNSLISLFVTKNSLISQANLVTQVVRSSFSDCEFERAKSLFN